MPLLNIKRKRDWPQCRTVIGDTLYDMLDSHFNRLATNETFNVLEVGCGEGNTAIDLTLKYKNINFVALDVSANHRISFANDPVFIQEDIQNYCLEDSYDCIFSIAVMPYVADKLKALLNIWRSLKVNGIAVISISPYYFGPNALEMFADGDIKWDEKLQSLVIHKSTSKADVNILPCLNYELLEHNHHYKKIESKKVYCWPDFFAFSKYKDPWTGLDKELKPYPQSLVSLYKKKTEKIECSTCFFTEQVSYPAIMVKSPGTENRDVIIKYFNPKSIVDLPIYKPSVIDVMVMEKRSWQYLSKQQKYHCSSMPKHPVRHWLLAQEMDRYKSVTQRYLRSEGQNLSLRYLSNPQVKAKGDDFCDETEMVALKRSL